MVRYIFIVIINWDLQIDKVITIKYFDQYFIIIIIIIKIIVIIGAES